MREGAVLFCFARSNLIDGNYVHWYNKKENDWRSVEHMED